MELVSNVLLTFCVPLMPGVLGGLVVSCVSGECIGWAANGIRCAANFRRAVDDVSCATDFGCAADACWLYLSGGYTMGAMQLRWRACSPMSKEEFKV